MTVRTLYDETRMGTTWLQNRFIRSATLERMADGSGRPTPRLVELYNRLADGGIGLIITGATTISLDTTRIPGMLSIPDNTFVPGYRELTGEVHARDCPIVMQLVFPGRNGVMWTPLRPSSEEMVIIRREFGDPAFRAKNAGFDGVQIHAAHGYFLSQFMNREKNTRTDGYGGETGGRVQFLLEIYDEIRARTGDDFMVLVKINCLDGEDGDGVFETCRYACTRLAEKGVNGIELSGGVSGMPFPPRGLPYPESVFRDYAAEVARVTDIPVILVGLNRDQAVMRHILATTRIEYFSLCRPLIRQPDLVRTWRTRPDVRAGCISCDECRQHPGGIACCFRQG